MERHRDHFTVFCILLSLIILTGIVVAADEIEPNNTTTTATFISAQTEMAGNINPIGDIDIYTINGINTLWGYIALLDTSASSESRLAVLSALDNTGMTVQSDTGSWEFGYGIALQNFTGNNKPHYLKVTEEGNDDIVTPYTLRYFTTVIATQPEVEPNNTLATGTPSGFTHAGAINPIGDVDCYCFHGRAGDKVILAVNGDPEADEVVTDVVLELLDPSATVLKTADVSVGGGKEFIESSPLAGEGVYCYRISGKPGSGGPADTYNVGIIRNGGLYFPSYSSWVDWLNQPEGGSLRIGQEMTLSLYGQNTSPVKISGNINLIAEYEDECFNVVETTPPATSSTAGRVAWDGQKTDLDPGETYSVQLTLRAKSKCTGVVWQNFSMDYFFTSTGNTVDYTIDQAKYLPALQLLLED